MESIIPGVSQTHVLGVIHADGSDENVTLYNLRYAMRLPRSEVFPQARIALIGSPALLVDSISEVVKLDAQVIEKVPETFTQVDRSFLLGKADVAGKPIYLLDLKEVCIAGAKRM